MKAMQWHKLGLIDHVLSARPGYTHAMVPTPVLLEDRVRLYYSIRDDFGRALPYFVDLDLDNPLRVIEGSVGPLISLGLPGSFDDNGVMPTSIVRTPEGWLMYYVGFEICTQVRYRLMTGLAKSLDGRAFTRFQTTPILDRSPGEELFRGGPFVLREDDSFRLWYVGGNSWTNIEGRVLPVYDLRYLKSADGSTWGASGLPSLRLTDPDEHGFGRPWVRRTLDGYELYFSVRKRSLGAYRLGYGISLDGLSWTRADHLLNLGVSQSGFDSNVICYAAPLKIGGLEFCFYNGDDLGRAGIGLAVRQ